MEQKKTSKKRKVLITFLVIYGIILFNWNFTGSRSGTVVDAQTGEPIEGAVVCMQWFTPGFLGISGERGAAFYETLTDSHGRYYVPGQFYHDFHWFGNVKDEQVLIYKDGFSACEVTEYGDVITFGKEGCENTYRPKKNMVKLRRFEGSREDHADHISWIERYGIYKWPKQLIEKELEAEKKRVSNWYYH